MLTENEKNFAAPNKTRSGKIIKQALMLRSKSWRELPALFAAAGGKVALKAARFGIVLFAGFFSGAALGVFRPLRRAARGSASGLRHLLKKVDENF